MARFGLGTVIAVLEGAFGAVLAALGILEQFAILTASQLDGWTYTDLYVTGGLLVVIAVVAYVFDQM